MALAAPPLAKAKLAAKARTSFLKKRSKKLLHVWLRLLRIGSAQTRKSFLVLFFKKELLASLSLSWRREPAPKRRQNDPADP
jgi:hypothetical protein